MNRLSARSGLLPSYDRSAPPAIAHLGLGAFVRAHLGTYADDLLRTGWPATIRGVSLRDRRAEDQLAPQDGLYTVTELEPGRAPAPRVVGSITSAATGPAAAIEAIASPGVRLVTLTVTEKGYELDPDDVEHPVRPRSAPAVIAAGLHRRRLDGSPAPVVASLDNLSANGRTLRDRVLDVAGRLDPELPAWVRDEVRFPSSVVDRMVPATTPADIEVVSELLDVVDLAAVTAEHHRSWFIEAADGLPPLGDVGVQVVADTTPYERRKLWLLNGPHSALAYCGLLLGCETIATAAEHPAISSFVRHLVDDILEVADLPGSLAPATFGGDALARFRNPSLGHTCAQVGADGSRKLAQRLFPVISARRSRRRDTSRFAIVIAIWIASASGIAVRGEVLPAIVDPSGDDLARVASGGDLGKVAATALGEDGALVAEVAIALDRLVREGASVVEDQR